MKDLIEMALDAGFLQKSASIFLCNTDCLKDFEALIRTDEREVCAKVCEGLEQKLRNTSFTPNGFSCANAIRAKGNT